MKEIERFTFLPIYFNDGKRQQTILCQAKDAERVIDALAECETITEFAKIQCDRLHIDNLYIKLPWDDA